MEGAMTGSNLWTDGKALADPFRDVFASDVTAAVGRCGSCGGTQPMAEVRVFDHAPGLVARCPVCDQALLRLVHAPAAPGWTCAQPSTALVDDSQHRVSGRYRAVAQVLRMEPALAQR